MKSLFQNRGLCIAVAVSVLIHAVVLSARFAVPTSFDLKKGASAIEVVLVSPPSRKTIHAGLLKGTDSIKAVSSGGNTAGTPGSGKEKGEAPNQKKTVAGSEKSSKRAQASGTAEKKIMSKRQMPGEFQLPDDPDSRSVVFRRNGNRNGGDTANGYGAANRPVITASTRDVGYAMYYKALRKRVENLGLINFPQKNGSRLYGELMVRIPVFQDGTLFEKEGGPSIERSSGNPALDKAALGIIRRAAPFGPFPKSMRSKNGGADVWIIITRLKFTREQGIQSQIRSTVH